jgi:thiosulfate dehydrogenase
MDFNDEVRRPAMKLPVFPLSHRFPTVKRLTTLGLATTFLAVSSLAVAAEQESSLARGGLLYDKWFKVVGAAKPTADHPAYPKDKKSAGKASANWRCKECHGWDYRGAAGAYSSGSHFSGIKGIDGMQGADPAKVVALLKDPVHGYGDQLAAEDLHALALFVSQGQIDMDRYIDRASKQPKGDAARGAAYFNTVCAHCHGEDGLQPKEMVPFGKQMGNPWEVMHKIMNGQPDEKMPALRAFDHQIAADIMAHMATLPQKR